MPGLKIALLSVLVAGALALGGARSDERVAPGGAGKALTKSVAYYVGKDLTSDGSVLLGGFGHEPSSHWLEIVPRRQFPAGATTTVGVTERAELPGELSEIPQAPRTFKYITSNYSEFAGFPAPLTNGGLNENGVAARDVWSPTADRLLALTERPQRGPNYSDLSRIAMERARTAREAVEILGRLIDEHGYSDYGGNSHLFADAREGWIFINYGGSQRLWAAERLGPDEIRVSGPGYINPLPLDYKRRTDEWLASDNFIDFAVEKGWFDPDGKDAFDAQEVYAGFQPDTTPGPCCLFDGQPSPTTKALERELREIVAPVSLEDMLAWVRDPRWSHDRSGYGQVAQLTERERPELQVLWVAVTGSVTTPYVPIHIGAEDVPPEYKQHRYMTSKSDDSFLAADYAALEATPFATHTFKRLMYYTCEHPEAFLKPVTAELEAFEQRELDEQRRIAREALRLLRAGREDAARRFLTAYAARRLLGGMRLGDDLVEAVDAITRRRYGIRMPTGRDLPGETMRPESQDMSRDEALPGRAGQIVTCHRPDLERYPRRFGSYRELVGRLAKERRGI
jgi:dipeptidase